MSAGEIASLVISIVTLVISFSYFISSQGLIYGLVIGFIAHELAHKFVAQSLGYYSEYKVWSVGLVLAIASAIATRGTFVFAAPGYVTTHGHAPIKHVGLVSLAAPLANIILAMLFVFVNTPLSMEMAYINILLAGFNLLPLGPMDGSAVYRWSVGVWGTAMLFCVVFGAAIFVGYF